MVTGYSQATCRDSDCGARIIWAITSKGKRMPVDADPAPDGTVLLAGDDPDAPVATVVSPAAPPSGGWPGPLRHSHFTTCPGADRWRSRKAARR